MKRIFIVFAALLLSGFSCSRVSVVPPEPQPQPVACTMEAKQCPDGSYVSRTGSSCEFAVCPTTPSPAPNPVGKICRGTSDATCGQGYQCIQDCGPPVMRIDEPAPPFHCQTDAVAQKPRMCPICLASNTRIATPRGEVNVTDITVGMVVWSLDMQGSKVRRTIVKVSRTPVASTHKVVHLVLSDERQVWVSPSHPATDGRLVGVLHAGESFDGAMIVSAELVPYWDTATYDLLPDGDTGAYWANGIPLKSTLFSR